MNRIQIPQDLARRAQAALAASQPELLAALADVNARLAQSAARAGEATLAFEASRRAAIYRRKSQALALQGVNDNARNV